MMRSIAIRYENEAWMAPLFHALEATGAPYDAPSLVGFDPHARFERWLVERATAYQPVAAVA